MPEGGQNWVFQPVCPYPGLYHGFLPTMSKLYKAIARDISLSSVIEAGKGSGEGTFFRPYYKGRRLS